MVPASSTPTSIALPTSPALYPPSPTTPLRHAHGLLGPTSRSHVKAGLLNWFGDINFSEAAYGFTLDDHLRGIRSHLDLTIFTGLLRIKQYTCSGLLHELVSVHR